MGTHKENHHNLAQIRHVFAYGSLIWRPGFEYLHAKPARIHGLHRSFCVTSVHWRGTRAKPGLVLGLDYGGSCQGLLFKVRAADWPEVRHYLRAREQVTMVYREVVVRARDETGRTVPALTFAVDRAHRQYAGRMDMAKKAEIIQTAHGVGGPNTEYLHATLDAMAAHGIADPHLQKLARLVDRT